MVSFKGRNARLLAPRIFKVSSLGLLIHALAQGHGRVPTGIAATGMTIIEASPRRIVSETEPALTEALAALHPARTRTAKKPLTLGGFFVAVFLVVHGDALAKARLPLVVEELALRVVVAVDHLAVLVVLRESRLGGAVDGRPVAGGGVQGDDGGTVRRLLVEVFSDFALSLGTLALVHEEEREEDDCDEGDDTNTSHDVLPQWNLDYGTRRKLALVVSATITRNALLVGRAVSAQIQRLLASVVLSVAEKRWGDAVVTRDDGGELRSITAITGVDGVIDDARLPDGLILPEAGESQADRALVIPRTLNVCCVGGRLAFIIAIDLAILTGRYYRQTLISFIRTELTIAAERW